MPLKDFTEWFEDLSVHVDDQELIEEAATLEPMVLHSGSRIGAAVWISWRVGWRVMWSESGKPFPTQATSLRSFSLR